MKDNAAIDDSVIDHYRSKFDWAGGKGLIKKLNLPERGARFRHFCVSKVITTAHAHKSGVIFHFFPRAFKQKKIKALRPKMTKIASIGGGGGSCLNHCID